MCSANPRFGGGGGSVDRFCCGRCNWFGAEFDGGGDDGVLGCTNMIRLWRRLGLFGSAGAGWSSGHDLVV